jgi:hypothetical protein
MRSILGRWGSIEMTGLVSLISSLWSLFSLASVPWACVSIVRFFSDHGAADGAFENARRGTETLFEAAPPARFLSQVMAQCDPIRNTVSIFLHSDERNGK